LLSLPHGLPSIVVPTASSLASSGCPCGGCCKSEALDNSGLTVASVKRTGLSNKANWGASEPP
jgi:hypothetical protein